MKNFTCGNFDLIPLHLTKVKFVFDPLKRRFEQSNLNDYSSDHSLSMNSRPIHKLVTTLPPPTPSKNAHRHPMLQQVSIKDYYDDYDPILYQYNDYGKEKTSIKKPSNEYQHSEEDVLKQEEKSTDKKDSYYVDSFNYEYQYDSPGNSNYDRQGRQRRSEHGLSLSPVISEFLHVGDKHGNNTNKSEKINYNSHRCGKYCSSTHKKRSKHKHRNPSTGAHHTKSHSKHSRKKSHHSSTTTPGTYSPFSRYKRSASGFSNISSEIPARSLEGVIRVAFNNLRMTSTYLIRGSAGDVFKFREQGTFELSSPAVYLVSRLRMVLPSGQSRHTRRNR